MTKLDSFWMSNNSWYHVDKDWNFVIDANAPKEAQESYKRYLKQYEAAQKRGSI